MSRSRNSERGQVFVLTTLFLTGMLGITALTVDVGSWFRAQRDTQRIADAAALAGAQALPWDVAKARADANHYTAENGGSAATISFRSTNAGIDTIEVEVRRDAPGFFAKLFGIDSVNVGAKATALSSGVGAARWVAPIVVNEKHPMLNCNPQPCFGRMTEIELDHLHKPGSGNASGSFALISLNNDEVDSNTVSDWLLRGYDGFMQKDQDYRTVPSAQFNSGQFRSAMEQRMNTEMLFPIYRKITGSGSNAEYEVIGFVGFVVTDVVGGGSNQTLKGYFTRVVWESLPASTPNAGGDFGVRSIELIE
jgi:hypothetical protein